VAEEARRWSRIELARFAQEQTETTVMEFDPARWVSGMVEEMSSGGLWMLPHGLRAGDDAVRRLATGAQAGSPHATFSVVRRPQPPEKR